MKTALATSLALVLLALPALAEEYGAAKLTVKESEEHGKYVADAEGRALYMFMADKQGKGDEKAETNCYGACAEAWPPLITDGEPMLKNEGDDNGLKKDLLGTIERRDGKMQVTYGGWPLYYYVRDEGEGDTTGQDVHGFGGGWYLVAPNGKKIEEDEGAE